MEGSTLPRIAHRTLTRGFAQRLALGGLDDRQFLSGVNVPTDVLKDRLLQGYGRMSTSSSFGAYTVWASDAGDEGDIVP